MLLRQKPSTFPFCDICKLVNRRHREACSKCLDCAKLLCKDCVEMHKAIKVVRETQIFRFVVPNVLYYIVTGLLYWSKPGFLFQFLY